MGIFEMPVSQAGWGSWRDLDTEPPADDDDSRGDRQPLAGEEHEIDEDHGVAPSVEQVVLADRLDVFGAAPAAQWAQGGLDLIVGHHGRSTFE